MGTSELGGEGVVSNQAGCWDPALKGFLSLPTSINLPFLPTKMVLPKGLGTESSGVTPGSVHGTTQPPQLLSWDETGPKSGLLPPQTPFRCFNQAAG